MNNPYAIAPVAPIIPATTATMQESEDIDFLGMLDTMFNSRWLVITITLTAVLIGGTYAYLSQPIYRADSLIQVEQSQNAPGDHVLGELASAFNIQSPATAEIEILRSRLVVGEASDKLKLYISAEPNYLPIIGRWLSKHATQLSNPGLIGFGGFVDLGGFGAFGGYVWGSEAIQLDKLEVQPQLENKKLTVLSTEAGYQLLGPDGERLANGKVGVSSTFGPNESGRILISKLEANPGATFTVVRHSRQNVIEGLRKDLSIDEKGKPSGVLSMSLEDTNAVQAAQILNAIGAAYVKQNTERKAAEAEKSLTFLDGFLPQLKQQMDTADNKYTAFRDKHGTFDLGTEGTLSLNTSVAMQTKLFELQQKRRELSAQFAGSHPSILSVDAQIAALEKEVNRLAVHIKTLPELEQQLLNLVRDVKVNGEMYAGLLNSAQQLRLVKEGKVGNVRVVDAAVPPEIPVKPQRSLILAISAILGLALGAGLALFRNMMRPGVKAANDIQYKLGMDVYATVPRMQPSANRKLWAGYRAGLTRVLAEMAPDDPAVESLRSLRMSLRFALEEARNNIVMLTGPTPNIGKTFTSVNLAAVLGSADKRVLLIDTDFRSGSVHRYFGLEREQGFSELIRGNLTLPQVLHKSVMPNVDVITTGVLPRNPAEALLSERAKALLQQLSDTYDVVILDTAPVLPVSDALSLAPHAGTIFMLARAEFTTLGELEESTKRLNQAGAHVTGVVFNDFNAAHHRFSAKYGSYQSYLAYGSPR
ncbi:polysaccharide biosynthesis tyrosine autokinase [Allopusillimonas ginsengisoli]|nr:polysaccharide biosynthesis tyrosine autokinase [Allopusillimonas ginsengisoli]